MRSYTKVKIPAKIKQLFNYKKNKKQAFCSDFYCKTCLFYLIINIVIKATTTVNKPFVMIDTVAIAPAFSE